MTESLLGLAEIAELYSVPKQTAATWTRRRDFPSPAHTFAMGPCWRRDDVLQWRSLDQALGTTELNVRSECPRCGCTEILWAGVHQSYDVDGYCHRCGTNVIVSLRTTAAGSPIETIIKERA